MNRSGVSASKQQRQERRLALLSDDNAFVDIQAILRPAGSLEGRTHSGSPLAARGDRAVSGTTADTSDCFLDNDATEQVRYPKGTAPRAAKTVVGSAGTAQRIHLSHSLYEQHKTYCEAVKTAWTESSSDGDDDPNGKERASKAALSRTSSQRERKLKSAPSKRNNKGAPDLFLQTNEKGSGVLADPENVAEECEEECHIIQAWKNVMSLSTAGRASTVSPTSPALPSLPMRVLSLLSTCPSYHAMTAPPALEDSAGSADARMGAEAPARVSGCRSLHLCSVCMLPAAYRCIRCRTALFCSIECHVVHDATRCMKFIV